MPIYEYACDSCGHQFEKLVRIGAEAPPCPECEGAEVRKRVSASGFILKGSGWYKDHYGLKSGGSKESSSSGGSSTGGGAKSTGGDTKAGGSSSGGEAKSSGGSTASSSGPAAA